MSTLPFNTQTAHAVGFASVTPGANWNTEITVDGAGGTTALTRLDGGSRPAASLTRIVRIAVSNFAASGSDTIYVTCKDPGAGAATLGHPVPPQATIGLEFYGTETPINIWVYGAAATPQVVVVATLAEK